MIPAEQETEPVFCQNLGFLMTYRCQVACPHCIIGAGPHRTEEMSEADILAWIEQAARVGRGRIKCICLTGGEPFCDLERLRQVSLFILAHGRVPTVVTNAFWAVSPEVAIATLESLPALRVISISTDAHHLACIPMERVENALHAVMKLNLHYNVAVCTEDESESRHVWLLERLSRLIPRDRIRVTITSPAGRAGSWADNSRFPISGERPRAACAGAHTPVVFPDGRVIACIGPIIDIAGEHPLMLGNLHDQPLEQILEKAEMNPVLHILRVWGPGKLCEILEDQGMGGRLPQRFIKDSLCNLCYTILNDVALCDALRSLAGDTGLMQKIAWGREFYLQETAMSNRI